ncbi:uncharacterized protein LOC113273153 [Papaver somniferum]|uniref:uncharacterized protein LOC113273153 n=1 Tax=Papaver somniferum TaxID=3469 RepID=UPI000E6FC0E1|nr:uncharacterized protein LOC113273153 [Papaver somniferum]
MWHVLPWELCGDFNVARRREEKKNCRRTSLSMLDFNDFIIFHELIDLPLKGSRFTWTSGEDNPILCRLDRFLITPDFEQKFPLSTQTALSRPISDHLPLILDTVDASLGPSPFRFEAMWFLVPGFLEKFQAWWNSLTFSRSPSSTLWLEEMKRLNEEQKALRIKSKVEYEQVSIMLERSIRQNSRVQWLKEGGRNVSFFHSMASSRRRQNMIKHLFIDGELTDDRHKIKSNIINHFENLFKENCPYRPFIDDLEFVHISEDEATSIERDISEDEVIDAIKELDAVKAPGPDGYPIIFFKK